MSATCAGPPPAILYEPGPPGQTRWMVHLKSEKYRYFLPGLGFPGTRSGGSATATAHTAQDISVSSLRYVHIKKMYQKSFL